MRHFKRFIAVVLFCAVGATAWYIFSRNKPDHTDQLKRKKAGIIRLLGNAGEIHRLWREGEESREWSKIRNKCLEELKITQLFDESLLRCHPLLIECHAKFSKNLTYKIMLLDQTNTSYRYLTKSNVSHVGLRSAGVNLSLRDMETSEQVDLFLADHCHEVYLEQRIFAYGEPPSTREVPDYRFDNFNQHVYLDRHLVTNSDVNVWLIFGNPDFTKGIKAHVGNDLFYPSTQLTFHQMENFCSFKGKQIMLAHFNDAAAFLPMDQNETMPISNQRSPYHWTKKKSEYKADCKFLFAKECLSRGSYKQNLVEPSWAGLIDVMGGVLEVYRNPIDPDSNLKASSFYFPFKSTWHKLGFRAYWDGEGHDLRNFDFRGINPEDRMDKLQVGFRCMRGILPSS